VTKFWELNPQISLSTVIHGVSRKLYFALFFILTNEMVLTEEANVTEDINWWI
jgi:hypothetical protein